ncbi:hypothetical protein D6O09_23230 [Salmonella enterica]|nr:hypothetical protein [Salmonella enterica]EAU2298857.1 hypothetical protein [Salmonella enterica]
MSERMKQGGRGQGMTPAALWQHQRRGREALQHTANRAPHPQWRMFARERARRCREKSFFRQGSC